MTANNGRKTWLLVKRGLVTDPEHRERLGVRIWVYLHVLDRADWETGEVPDWVDADEAADLDMPLETLRKQRRQLQDAGYITCHLAGQKQRIEIHKWVNPRRYDGKVQNVPEPPENAEGGQYWQPPEGGHPVDTLMYEGGQNRPPQGIERLDTPSLSPQKETHNKESSSGNPAAGQSESGNPQADMVGALSDVTGLDYRVKRNAGRMAKVAAELREAGYTADQVDAWYRRRPGTYWWESDWRGQRGSRPTPEQVAETIGRAADYAAERKPKPKSTEALRQQLRRARQAVNDDAG